MTVLPQEPFLVPGSIRLNLDPYHQASDADVTSVLQRAGLKGLLSKYSLDTPVDRDTWSSGQRQMLCLERAMMGRNKIMILDEGASSADAETEALMQDIIDTEFRDCTVLAVMYRLAHVAKYDRIALLDSGRLVECDDPKKLSSRETMFKRAL